LVSVVIPSYNHRLYVKEAIESVLASSVRDIEVIVVDDGSTDESVETIRSIRDSRIRLFVQSNMGAHCAINRGVSLASAPWVAILNSDDRFHPEKLERHLDVHSKEPFPEASASRVRYVSANGMPCPEDGYFAWHYERLKRAATRHPDLFASLLVANHLITSSSLFIKKQAFLEIGGFLPLRYNHDWFMFLTLAARHRFLVVEEALVDYRRHMANTISENGLRGRVEVNFLLDWHFFQNLSSQNPTIDSSYAFQLLNENRHVCYALIVLFQFWRQLNGNNLTKASAIFSERHHPVMKLAFQILSREKAPVTPGKLIKRVFGRYSLRVADYAIRSGTLLRRLSGFHGSP